MRHPRVLTVTAAWLWLAGSACAGPATPPVRKQERPGAGAGAGANTGREGKMQQAERTVRIEETTVATVDGWRVTVGNIMKGKWRGPDGQEREGVTALVGLYDEKKAARGESTVGEGAQLTIAGKRWTVSRV